MNISQLRRFVELAQSGSFTRAAQDTNLTQPAFSRSIMQLEEQLGMKLFDRIGRSVELTAFGRVMLKYAQRVVHEADEFLQVAERQREGRAGKIKISLGSTPSALLTKPLLVWAATQGTYMGMSIERGSISYQIDALLQRELDLLVIESTSLPAVTDLDIELLEPMPVGFVASASHPAAKETELQFHDIMHYPIGSSMVSETQIRNYVAIYGAEAHPDKRLSLYCEDIAVLLEAVRATDTIYIGTLAPARAGLEDGSLVQLPVVPKYPYSQFAIVSLASRSKPPVFDLICDFIRETLRG